MYGKFGTTVTAAGATTSLAYTGVPVLWLTVSGLTMIAAGFAALRLFPRRMR